MHRESRTALYLLAITLALLAAVLAGVAYHLAPLLKETAAAVRELNGEVKAVRQSLQPWLPTGD